MQERIERKPTLQEMKMFGLPKWQLPMCKMIGDQLYVTPLSYPNLRSLQIPEEKTERPLTKKEQIAKYAYERCVLRRKATPPWANLDEIKKIYKKAKAKSLGNHQYVVDHIIPLKHPLVCGLHVESNLQIIRASENARKHNKFNPKDFQTV